MTNHTTLGAPLVPALRFHALTGLYDRVIAATLREDALRARLVAQAAVRPAHRVLDLGSGTGTLALMLRRLSPGAEVTGVDGDPAVVELARRKVEQAGLEVDFRVGLMQALPFPDASFDRVVTSLVLHHLDTADKRKALAEARRVLRPDGQLHVLDFGRPASLLQRLAFVPVRLLDGRRTTDANVRGALPTLIAEAGFSVETTHVERTLLGTLDLLRAQVRP